MAVDYDEGRRLLAALEGAKTCADWGAEGAALRQLERFMVTHAEALLNPVSAAPSPAALSEEERARFKKIKARDEYDRSEHPIDWEQPHVYSDRAFLLSLIDKMTEVG